MINKRTFLTMLAKIGLPIVLQQVISLSLNMIDTFMIGSVGVSELAAVGAANKIYFIFSTICFGLYSGASIFISQYWGVKNVKQIQKVVSFYIYRFYRLYLCPTDSFFVCKRGLYHFNRCFLFAYYLLYIHSNSLFFFNEF